MKRILIYGDSNTWGETAFDGGRLEDEKQWPVILQSQLGKEFKIIQEGLGGRIAGDYETSSPHCNGQRSFEVIFRSASPVSALVVALGTNDIKNRYNRSAEEIVADLLWYEKTAKELLKDNENINPATIYILPPNFSVSQGYYEADEEVRSKVISLMKQKVENYILLNDLEMTEDGVHFSERAHQEIANAVEAKIKELL